MGEVGAGTSPGSSLSASASVSSTGNKGKLGDAATAFRRICFGFFVETLATVWRYGLLSKQMSSKTKRVLLMTESRSPNTLSSEPIAEATVSSSFVVQAG
jgi:hypothetical protein